MSRRVFLSVGSTSNAKQEQFVKAVEDRLRAEDFMPHTVGRNTFSVDAPLKTVERLMEECVGTVVVALERTFFPAGFESRNGDKQKELADVALPTPWNQIEAAMTYSRKMPLLVIVEDGLKDEGLLEPGYDWYVQKVPVEAAYLNTPEFNGVLASWKAKTESFSSPVQTDQIDPVSPSELTIGQILGGLKPAHLWKVLGACSISLVGAFSLGANLAKNVEAPIVDETPELVEPTVGSTQPARDVAELEQRLLRLINRERSLVRGYIGDGDPRFGDLQAPCGTSEQAIRARLENSCQTNSFLNSFSAFPTMPGVGCGHSFFVGLCLETIE